MRSSGRLPLTRVALLGVAGGMRTFVPPAGLALTGRLSRERDRRAALASVAGELLADKHPAMPSRLVAVGIVARGVSSGGCGLALAGPAGAAVAAATALVSANAMFRVRRRLALGTPVADPVWGAAEDGLAIGLAAVALR